MVFRVLAARLHESFCRNQEIYIGTRWALLPRRMRGVWKAPTTENAKTRTDKDTKDTKDYQGKGGSFGAAGVDAGARMDGRWGMELERRGSVLTAGPHPLPGPDPAAVRYTAKTRLPRLSQQLGERGTEAGGGAGLRRVAVNGMLERRSGTVG